MAQLTARSLPISENTGSNSVDRLVVLNNYALLTVFMKDENKEKEDVNEDELSKCKLAWGA